YRLLDPSSGHVFVSRSVTFDESASNQTEREEKSDGESYPQIVDVPTGKSSQSGDRTHDQLGQQLGPYPTEPDEHMIVPWTPPPVTLSVPTQLSTTPGRDGEDESSIRPVRKRREVVRYENEFQQPFQL